MKCEKCGREFKAGNRPDGLPNGVTFALLIGAELTVCSGCICRLTKADADAKNKEWKACKGGQVGKVD